jgi:hypothetical protein
MKLDSVGDQINIQLSREEFRFLYMNVYVAIQFVDDVDFASVTGLHKENARKFLEECDLKIYNAD